MLSAFINKNERFLRLCCNLARFFGLLLLALVAIALIGILLLGILKDGWSAPNIQQFVKLLPKVILRLVFPVFLLLGIEQLIKCLIVSDFKPNWILRFSDKIIYIYVSLIIANFVYTSTCTHKNINSSGNDILFALTFMPPAISTFVKVLIWIGIGLLLKRIVPIIKESKTFV